ncbi:succinate-semialdehyde dehydrogenase/glutarate-semialdehyde dehydrogenase [Microbacteriaceae bacterium SG_E_30_P1]|uniref:Succinate-semialdehyde dehydrogenase/glutarate-semialdehyde dehydrogenase n=1 Tax=Antiquaquibacter oligotrophicus TaxID=2880260 RepID=A0ABT6KSV5_9MICO|nr:NAD-dependent succinate-semialdehyde dehydrogenase [Antiquaquibacter oligotrophicus]MDH6182142.1 succinate-semialdehyde dehydrogenase/glutarate-semialdehyde dehydrogenase [Antiquaquibacter oligotrophicus]UDF12195.1 NAD-dependent succinate-semialdehyde dehydrogenase [Antiquaquibacter oligotrophicus]
MAIATLNPTTGVVERTFEPHTAAQVEEILERAAAANALLRDTTFAERSAWMHRAADLMDADVDVLAALAATEMGKTIGTARYEVTKSANGMRHYADNAERYLAPERPVAPVEVGASAAHVVFQPIGTVLAVMPWNYPFWQVIRFAAPALMAGNTGLLKHASSVPQVALYLGELFERAGFPAGAFQTLLVEGAAASALLDDRRIAAVTLTGSVGAGSAVAEAAGRNIKKSVLELGGTDAFIVMPSADVQRSAEFGANSRTQNSGQSCICAKRFYIHEDIYDEWFEAFLTRMRSTTPGDPFDPATSFGPMATESVRAEAHALVADAVSKGVTVHTGGELPGGPGWFYPATVLTGVTTEMRIYREECFGPVACVYRVGSVEEAIALANDSEFGLAASVWTTDADEIALLQGSLEFGAVFTNGNTASFFGLPFGGIKDSGYGRELGRFGIREFVNAKTVWTA